MKITAARIGLPLIGPVGLQTRRKENDMPRRILMRSPLALLLLVLLFTGCATRLAPSYDKAVVDGLNAANVDVMTFFASVAGGTDAQTYDERREEYANLIGRFDALKIQAQARPQPNNKMIERINDILSSRGVPIPEDSETPSATALAKISETLDKMSVTDKKQGITAGEAQAFKMQVSIFLDQALTYENFLQR